MVTDLESHLERTAGELLDFKWRETEPLCWALGLTREEIIRAYVLYDLGVNHTGNEVFDSVALRYAMHLHNQLQGSWHATRQEIVACRVESFRPSRIVEVGFGTPQLYVWQSIFRGTHGAEEASVHLLDAGYSGMVFGQSLLSLWSRCWSKVVRFRSYDMEKEGYVGDYDCYIFQDSIEHVSNPTRYLRETVIRAPDGADFLFSLPIEVVKVMPQHFISWRDTDEVQEWLSHDAGLRTLFRQEISVDRTVDIFAQKLHPEYRQAIFHCQKPR